MATYKTGYNVLDILRTHERFGAVMLVLRRAALNPRLRTVMQARLARVEDAYTNFNRRLEILAQESSHDTTNEIRKQLAKTAKRPDTGLRPHIRDAIVCRPSDVGGFRIPTGRVGIGDVDELDKVTNPVTPGYGPYWRTQEEGFTGHVGRTIRGLFFPSGGPTGGAGTPPDPSQFRVHPVFLPGGGGKGTIGRPIPARHFIARGTAIAGARWKARVKAIEAEALRELP